MSRRGFTLIELIVVVLILGILAAVAMPRFFDHRTRASEEADTAGLDAMTTAFGMAYADHQAKNAPSGVWIVQLEDIEDYLATGDLPDGFTIDGSELVDRRGNRYTLVAQTSTEPARFQVVGGGGGGGGGGGAAIPPALLIALVAPWLGASRRR